MIRRSGIKYVSTVQRILNSAISRSTRYTPFELLTEIKIRDREDLRINRIHEEEHENKFAEETIEISQNKIFKKSNKITQKLSTVINKNRSAIEYMI